VEAHRDGPNELVLINERWTAPLQPQAEHHLGQDPGTKTQ